MTLLAIRALHKNFGAVEILKGVNFTVEKGEFVCLLGPSGCGKSTLLRCIAGLETITSGEIEIGGEPMAGVSPAGRNLAMVFQSYALYPHLSVRNNMAFGLKLQGVPRAEIEHRVSTAARMLRIDQLLDRKPRQLSGGQRQRVAIGRAIVRDPHIFLFDEPLSNLDAALRTQMRHELTRLHKELGRTMIFVTHDQVEAMTLANKVVVLNNGIVEQIGRPLDLYHYPANLFVARFIGSPQMNIFPVTRVTGSGTHLDVLGTRIEVLPFAGEPASIGVRPEDLAAVEPTGAGIAATVKSVERLGAESMILGQAGGHDFVSRREGTAELEEGAAVSLRLRPGAVHVFDAMGRRIGGPQPDRVARPQTIATHNTMEEI